MKHAVQSVCIFPQNSMTSLWLTMKKKSDFFTMQKLHSGVWNWTFTAYKDENG